MRFLYYLLGTIFVLTFITGGVWCRSVGCEGDHDRAAHVLHELGYTDINVGEANAWNCGTDDSVSNDFDARIGGPAPGSSHLVHATLCCGFAACSKGCVVHVKD